MVCILTAGAKIEDHGDLAEGLSSAVLGLVTRHRDIRAMLLKLQEEKMGDVCFSRW